METNTTQAARGIGRWYRRQGVRMAEAAQYATTLYPELLGYEDAIMLGWRAERAGR